MYRRKVTVMPSESGCTNEIKLRPLLNLLQDTAGLAVASIEGAPGDLVRRGYGWVLLRYNIEISRLPGMDETVVIETRHTSNDGFNTLRVFRVFAENNEAETLVLAKTSWVLIDLAAGRPVRAVQHIPEIFSGVANDPPIEADFTPIPKLKDLPAARGRQASAAFPVRFHDLDANGHVNNAVYFEWMFEATPLDLTEWSISAVRAEFRVSAKLGDTVAVRLDDLEEQTGNDRTFVYEMTRADTETGAGAENARAMARFAATWRRA
ncbi:MAG: hypothetical protein LBR38_01665 [Synergistaceae bacterium]|nr:hypothetical protein [Synergistaceae bacterium]